MTEEAEAARVAETEATEAETEVESDDEQLARQAYVRAVKLLGSREHSAHELTQKLTTAGFELDIVDRTLADLQAANYQSDERFACLYCEQLVRKGQGPLAIHAKLAARGISSSLIKQAISQLQIDSASVDWALVAANALQSRFSLTQLTDSDQKSRGKLARFLQRRGFSTTDSIKAIRLATETLPD